MYCHADRLCGRRFNDDSFAAHGYLIMPIADEDPDLGLDQF